MGTYYATGMGSCGESDNDDELVVALNKEQMDNGANPNLNPECEKKVSITGEGGKSVLARIVDTCPNCKQNDLDMSPKVFERVCGDLAIGLCKIKWKFQNGGPNKKS
ncbi:RlpA-like double-psi beta-barrel-protein domain-containing protein-containing protein [Gongronella butleri]|nr:RlpA-like double-psi beta-barrel-protein domain-containing protein-containing protein [Gongronella butleri]